MQENYTQIVLSILGFLGLRSPAEFPLLPQNHGCHRLLSCVDHLDRRVIADLAPVVDADHTPVPPPDYHVAALISLGQDSPVELWLFGQDEDTCDDLEDATRQLEDFLA